jgi:GntR family transcriptional regulator, transcriptional repressor for pyruvate dehydrogenase complex
MSPPLGRRPRSLAHELVDAFGVRIREGLLRPGDKLPTEAAVMAEFGVSRTVVREALSRLQAGGQVETRHGVGTFVSERQPLAHDGSFRIDPAQLETLRDVVAVLELRIGVETEAAALAALRRTPEQLQAMRAALVAFEHTIAQGRDAVDADFQFHREVARATQNEHFLHLMGTLGAKIIPRARLVSDPPDPERLRYLRRVNAEHESILDAIESQDGEAARAAMRTHLANSRERRRRAQAALG